MGLPVKSARVDYAIDLGSRSSCDKVRAFEVAVEETLPTCFGGQCWKRRLLFELGGQVVCRGRCSRRLGMCGGGSSVE